MTAESPIKQVAVVGGGVIGAGWAAHFARVGMDVTVWDPDPAAGTRVYELLERTWPILEQLGLDPGASKDRVHVASTLAETVGGADFIQESAPERQSTKVSLYTEIERYAPRDTVIASSTSGFPMSEMQESLRTSDRMIVGHPFNPPYLVPLVEVVAGAGTSERTVTRTTAFYTAVQKYPLVLRQELPGFLGNRLQEAIWREALHLLANGEATVEEIDAAIVHGPGLRWAVMGPLLTFHVAGGEGGMAGFLEHFDHTLDAPWARFPAPEMTDQLRQHLVDGCEREAAGLDTAEIERRRDEALLAVLRAREPLGAIKELPS